MLALHLISFRLLVLVLVVLLKRAALALTIEGQTGLVLVLRHVTTLCPIVNLKLDHAAFGGGEARLLRGTDALAPCLGARRRLHGLGVDRWRDQRDGSVTVSVRKRDKLLVDQRRDFSRLVTSDAYNEPIWGD